MNKVVAKPLLGAAASGACWQIAVVGVVFHYIHNIPHQKGIISRIRASSAMRIL